MIPFVKSGVNPGIPFEDVHPVGSTTIVDPLWETYSMMNVFCRLPTHGFDQAPVSDEEAEKITAESLRYSLLRWIAEIQNPPTSLSYKPGAGALISTNAAVPVPDATPYPRERLEKVLKDSKFGALEWEHHWFWERQDEFKFDVPAGTDVTVEADGITLAKKGSYKLQFNIEYTTKETGAAGLPVDFKLVEPIKNSADLVGLIFSIKGRIEWYGDYSEADPYFDWANGLFAGLDARLKQHSPFSQVEPERELLRHSTEVRDFTVDWTMHLPPRISMEATNDGKLALSRVLCRALDEFFFYIVLVPGRPTPFGPPKLMMGLFTGPAAKDGNGCRLGTYVEAIDEHGEMHRTPGIAYDVDVLSCKNGLLRLRSNIPQFVLTELKAERFYLSDFGAEVPNVIPPMDVPPPYGLLAYTGGDLAITLDQVPTLIDIMVRTNPPIDNADSRWSIAATRVPAARVGTWPLRLEFTYDRRDWDGLNNFR
jgi:hypothetical protein